MAYSDQVEDYVGTFADTAALTKWLTAGGKLVVNLLPEEVLSKYATSLTDSGSGIASTGSRTFKAHKSGKHAIKGDSALAAEYTTAASLHYATATSPVWYEEGGSAFVVPGGGTILGVVFPTVAYTDSTIANFPLEHENAVILYASVQAAIQKMNTAIATLNGLSYTAPTAPTSPSIPVYSYTNASLGTYTATTVGSLGTVPTYTKPPSLANFTNTGTYIGTDKDAEIASVEIQAQRNKIDQYQSDIQNELHEFNKEMAVYQSTVQQAIEDARLAQQRILQAASETADINFKNEAQELVRQTQEYEAQLRRYNEQVQLYGGQVQNAAQVYTGNIQKASGEVQLLANLIPSLKAELELALQLVKAA